MAYTHEEQDCVLWVSPRLVWIYCDVKYPNTTFQCHEEGPMGGNLTVCAVCANQFFWKMESSRGASWCHMRKGRHPGASIRAVLIWCIHATIYFSYWPHTVRWICGCLSKDTNCGRCWVFTDLRIDIYRLILGMLCIMSEVRVCVVVICT